MTLGVDEEAGSGAVVAPVLRRPLLVEIVGAFIRLVVLARPGAPRPVAERQGRGRGRTVPRPARAGLKTYGKSSPALSDDAANALDRAYRASKQDRDKRVSGP